MTDATKLADGKVCHKCLTLKPLAEFSVWKKRGAFVHTSRCKACMLERYRSEPYLRRKNKRDAEARAGIPAKRTGNQYTRNPVKLAAHHAIANKIKYGKLIRPKECSVCGQIPAPAPSGLPSIQAHHDDYSKPLEIRWLCISCHAAHHAQEKAHG